METIVAGIDEIATETQLSEGWCYFVLPDAKKGEMLNQVKTLLLSSSMKNFHAKQMKETQTGKYEEFLKIIRKYSEESQPSLLSCTLNSPNWGKKFIDFCEGLFTNVMTRAGTKNTELIEITKRFVPPLFTLQRLISQFSVANKIRVEIDSDDIKRKYPSLKTKIRGIDISSTFLLIKFYNAYRNYLFPDLPVLQENGVEVLKDQKSIMIQAADVIGNFSTSYIFYKLGDTSKKRKLRAEIFEEVFGDKFSCMEFQDKIEIVNQNDLKLKKEGALTLKLGFF